MPKLRCFWFLLALLLLGAAPAALAQAAPAEIRTVEGITEYRLANGLTVLLAPDASKPTTTVNLTYRVGSRHEGYGESGAAHLLEHLLFKASATVADPKLEMTRRGARWNGTTGFDRTNYFAQFPSSTETLDWMVGWLAESMTQARLTQADLDTEMSVVRNELERAENDPARMLGARMRSAAYLWHGYGRDVLGARSDVERMPIERLRAFYRRYYRPDNAVLVVGGQFDAAATLARIAQAFGPVARPAEPLESTWTLEAAQDGERQVLLRRVGGNHLVSVYYHAPPAASPDFAALRVLAQMLSRERGPLGMALLQPRLVVSLWSHVQAMREPGLFMAGATLPATADEPQAASVLALLAQAVETSPVSEQAVATARAQVLQGMRNTQRDPEALSLALSESVAAGDWRLLFALRDWVEAVTAADVQRVVRTWLVPSNRTAGVYLAQAQRPTRAPAPAPVDAMALLGDYTGRQVAVASEDFALTPENIEQRTVKSRLQVGGEPGLRLAVLPRRTKEDRVTGTLRLRWGTAESLQGTSVLATMLGPMLTHGTRLKNTDQIAHALLGFDAQLSFSSSAGGLNANFELPARHFEAFAALLAELLQQPVFTDGAFERNRSAMLASLRSVQADPAALAGNALQRVFAANYPGSDPRHTRSHTETEELVRAASAAQLRDFWARFGGAGVGEIALVGPLEPAAVQEALQKHFGEWKSAEPRQAWTFAYPAELAPRRQILVVPDKANANYAARIPLAMDDESPDFPALAAAVQLLGGRPGSALWQRVREQEGLSYGVNASLSVPTALPGGGDRAASIQISASFAPANRERLQRAVREELALRAASGFAESEIGFARRAIASTRANTLAQPSSLASLLATNLRFGRDMAHYSRRSQAYERLDAAAVNAALARYLVVERLVEVSVGSFAD